MALKKTINTNIGVDATYHKISRFSVSEDNGTEAYTCTVIVSSYINEEARKNNKMLSEKTYIFKVSLFELETNYILKLLYNRLKNLEDFRDSTDI